MKEILILKMAMMLIFPCKTYTKAKMLICVMFHCSVSYFTYEAYFCILFYIGWMREGSHCQGRYQSNQAR